MSKNILAFIAKLSGYFAISMIFINNSWADPTSAHYQFKYNKIGLRDLGAPSYAPFAAQAVQALTNKFTFVAANGVGTAPPYFSDVNNSGDIAFLEGNWGVIQDSAYNWTAHTEVFNFVDGNYVSCFNEDGSKNYTNCNTTDRKSRFAIIKFNNDGFNYSWGYVDKSVTVNGHPITMNDARQHLIAHELGHAIGMDHEVTPGCSLPVYLISSSVMEAGIWCYPLFVGYTASDMAWINSRF